MRAAGSQCRLPLRVSFILVLAALLWAAFCGTTLADNVRPVYLDIEEYETGALRVTWKVPLNQKLPLLFKPSFPESFKASSPASRIKTPNAFIEKWTMVTGAEPLAGAVIGIEGLEETTTDALVRIQLADGSLHRFVLRPTERSTTIPAAGSTTDQRNTGMQLLLPWANPWLFVLLLVAAWLLSLTPAARRRGILLCAAALVTGSLCGYALGGIGLPNRLFASDTLSDAQAKRVLRGLMLNTYRAFVLERDEDVYDVLARSVAGEFLGEVYLQNREALRMDDTEGARSIVDRLDIKSIESMKRLPGGALAIVAQWDVYGSVRHWDHIHFRCNAYKAELTIIPTDDYWKLSRVQLLEEKRVI